MPKWPTIQTLAAIEIFFGQFFFYSEKFVFFLALKFKL